MRPLVLVLALTLGAPFAAAQDSSETTTTTPPQPAPPATPPSPSPSPSPVTSPPPPTSTSTIHFSSTPSSTPSSTSSSYSSSTTSLSATGTPRLTPTPQMAASWRSGRVLYGIGSVTGLVGAGLTLSSVIVAGVTGYPCNEVVSQISTSSPCPPGDPASPTDAAPLLGYMGSTTSALGFIFSAAGLGLQHRTLRQLGADPGRGLLSGGAALGVLGFAAVGASYFFGLTDYLGPHDQGLAILASTITGTVLCAVGTLLFTIDSSRLKKTWDRLSTF